MSDLSHGEIRSILDGAINVGITGYPRNYIQDVFPAYFVYTDPAERALWKRAYTIGDDNAATLGPVERVILKQSYEPVSVAAFSLDESAADGDVVLKRGKVFEAGAWEDKGFSLTPDELRAAAAAFTAVPNDLEHRGSILDGKLGDLRRVWPSADGATLFGEVAIPAALDTLLGAAPLKVSLAWNKATKRIAKNALVVRPRISDAALFAAFNVEGGSPDKEVPVAMTAEEERGLFGRFVGFLRGADLGASATPPAAIPAPAQFAADAETPREKALREQLEAVQRTLATNREATIATEAVAFADGEIAALRAVPAQRDAMIAIFGQAARDDANHGLVTFAEGKTESRTAMLRAEYAARPKLVLTTELVPLTEEQAKVVQAQFAAPATAETVSDTERERLLAMTATGQAAQRSRQK